MLREQRIQFQTRYAHRLTYGTLFYLLIPFLIFLAGWIRLIYALPACFLLVFATYHVVSQIHTYTFTPPPIRYRLLAFLVAVYWCVSTGLGEWIPETTDFFKHNLILGDLVRIEWPVRYQQPNTSFLCYYLAWYLPIALFGKLFGLQTVPFVTFLWSLGGLYLVFNWVLVIGGRYRLGAFIGFTLLSGFHLIRYAVNTVLSITPYSIYKTLPPLVFYPCQIKHWMYVPNQILGGGFVLGWAYIELVQRKKYDLILFILSLGFFYSPFAMFGMIPLLLATWPSTWRRFVSIPNLIGAPIIVFFLISYYLAHNSLGASGWNIPQNGEKLAFLINTLITDVVLPLLVIWWLQHRYIVLNQVQWRFIVIGTVFKFLIAFYYVGFNNDLLMNASLSVSSLFYILMGMSLQRASEHIQNPSSFRFMGIMASFVIVCGLPLYMHVFNFIHWADLVQYASVSPTIERTAGHTIYDLNDIMHYPFKPNETYDFARQYVGSPNTFFYQYLLK